MKNLVLIDSGNTNLRMAKLHGQKWIVKTYQQQHKEQFLKDLPAEGSAVISSVNNSHQIKQWLTGTKIKPIFIEKFKKDQSFNNWNHAYSKTIGDDRIIQVYYLAQKFSNQKIALIDAGTFITCDFIKLGEYLGGTIHPGIDVFLESYHRGQKLPHLNLKNFQKFLNEGPSTFPVKTENAIFQATFEYLISLFLKINTQNFTHIYITGGNAELISEIVKTIPAGIKDQWEINITKNLIFDSMEYFYSNLNNKAVLQ